MCQGSGSHRYDSCVLLRTVNAQTTHSRRTRRSSENVINFLVFFVQNRFTGFVMLPLEPAVHYTGISEFNDGTVEITDFFNASCRKSTIFIDS